MAELKEEPVHFALLNEDEKRSKVSQFVLSDHNAITIWEKGQKRKESYDAINFFEHRLSLVVRPQKTTDLIERPVLINFELKGLMYFTKGIIRYDSDRDLYVMHLGEKLYRHERRSSFRLLTYPTYEANVSFAFEEGKSDEENYQSNVVALRSSSGNTGLFRNFLSFLNDTSEKIKKLEQEIEEEKKPPKSYNTSFRVVDISVEGLSFLIGSMGSGYFKKGHKLKSFIIRFEGKEFFIPNANIIYVSRFEHPDKKSVEQYKVGIEFKHMTTKLDLELSKHINRVMRGGEYEKEFEKFLK